MQSFVIAIAIVLIIEGLGPLLVPNRWRAYLKHISEQPVNTLRQIGGVLVISGALLLYWFN